MLGALNSANILSWLATDLIAYLIGTIPTAYLTVRWVKGQDIRCLGDRNAGAVNAARALGTAAGLAVGVLLATVPVVAVPTGVMAVVVLYFFKSPGRVLIPIRWCSIHWQCQ